jgi:hypothetical protein
MCWASSGVSPSAAGRSPARLIPVRQGWVRQGRLWLGKGCDGSTEGQPSLLLSREQLWQALVEPGRARLGRAWRGLARPGVTRQGLTISALSPSGLSAGFSGIQLWSGNAQLGCIRSGKVGRGLARRGKSCRQQHGVSSEAPCCSLLRADLAGPSAVWRGGEWRGMAMPDRARQGLTISARRATALPTEFTQQTTEQ